MEIFIVLTLLAGIISLVLKKKIVAYALGIVAFTALAVWQYTQGQTIGLIAFVFVVICIERLVATAKSL